MEEIEQMYMNAGNRNEFVYYLYFCAERLNEGATVEEIWNEWQEVNK